MPDPIDPSRLTRLEESLAFADRAAEEAGRQIVDLYRRLELLHRRIESLEKRFAETQIEQQPGSPTRITDDELKSQRPPHSA